MKKLIIFIIMFPFLQACSEESANQPVDQDLIPSLSGPYLGQSPPGKEFKQFAAGIVPVEMYQSVTVSPDGKEIYWAAKNGITVTKQINDRWTTPKVVSFSGKSTMEFYDDAPVVSPDNKKLFFNSLRPYGSNPAGTRWSFWYSERTASGWSEPQPLPDVINSTGGIHWHVSVSSSGTLYFGIYSQGKVGIYYSRLVNDIYTTPEPLSIANNLLDEVYTYVLCPFIAPDESYIIFNKVERGGVSCEYYISFKGSNNQWLSPQKLSHFPTEECTFVTRDGKYIFCKAYWASAQMIEDYRPK